MKSKTSPRMVSLILALVLIAIGGFILFGRSIGDGYEHAEKYTAGDTSLSSPVENLDIHWTSGSLTVEYYDGSEILVRETSPRSLSEDDKLRWWLDGTTLRIQFRKGGFRWFSFSSPEKALTVSLPKGLRLVSADIQATSADVRLPDLAADRLNLQSTSGDITAAADANQLSAVSTSGSLQITLGSVDTVSLSSTSGGLGLTAQDASSVSLSSTSGAVAASLDSAKKLSASSTSGGIVVALRAFEDLSVSATSGDVSASLPSAPGFTGAVSTTSGDFTSEIPLEKDGSTYTCGDGSARISIRTTSGDVRLIESK